MKWFAWVGVTAIVGLVFWVLANNADDPWGQNLPTIVQATSTVALLGVTLLYVVATQALAKTAAEDVEYAKNAPMREACDTLWARLNRDDSELRRLSLEITTAFDERDLDWVQFGAVVNDVGNLVKILQPLTNDVVEILPRLPRSVYEKATAYNAAASGFCLHARDQTGIIAEQLRQGHSDGLTFSRQEALAAWHDSKIAIRSNSRHFDLFAQALDVYSAIVTLQTAAFDFGK